MGIARIRERIEKTTLEPISTVCLDIVNRLAQTSPDQAQRITFSLLRSWIEKPIEDETFFSALTVLTSIKDTLSLYFIFLDEEDDREIEVSASEAFDAAKDNIFIHPRTGEEVENFKKLLTPVYKISETFFSNSIN
ncbi:hypothetical protein [Zymomonas mobilis]|uniref:hypothetical protein n=1 Tax=Zymomonas mobilis TaxID=542 RepID=UPI0021C497D7|nr:hypothetical protein [Zymomonas mobilis]MCP9308677.1 hypothetical protein [Zymomonas mobilis]